MFVGFTFTSGKQTQLTVMTSIINHVLLKNVAENQFQSLELFSQSASTCHMYMHIGYQFCIDDSSVYSLKRDNETKFLIDQKNLEVEPTFLFLAYIW
jgi:hypothetical protein